MTTNPRGSGIDAWAADAELAEAEEKEAEAAALAKAQATATLAEASSNTFPSLREAVTANKKKKKMTPLEFCTHATAPPGFLREYARLTHEEMLRLPTGPKERSADEMRYGHGRLGGGFRDYGTQSVSGRGRDCDEDGSWGGGGGGNRRQYGGFDEERRGAPSWAMGVLPKLDETYLKSDKAARVLKKLQQELEEADLASEIKKDIGADAELEDLEQKLRRATIKKYKGSLPLEEEEAESPPSQSHLADPLPALSSTKWKMLEELEQKLRRAKIKEYKGSLPLEEEEAESPPSQSHLADPLPALSSTKWKMLEELEDLEKELEDMEQKLRRATIKKYKGSLPLEEEEAESPPSQSHLADPLPALSSTKWKRLYLKIVESEIKEAESLPSDLLPEPSERNKLYFFFWHAYSPVMYSLYEVDVPIPLPPPPSKAVQDDKIRDPRPLSPFLQLKTGKYADGMCCVQLGSMLYFLGGKMNIDNPYIDEDVKKELKNVEPDVLPPVVYMFDLAVGHGPKDNDDLLPTSTSMNCGKASPLAFVDDEKIYVIGSTNQDLEVNRIAYFEMFDPKVDQWSILKNPPEINVNTIWVGHTVVGRKAHLVGWQQGKKRLYCFDLDTGEWTNISIPYCAGNFSGNIEFEGDTFYGCYYNTVAAIAPLVGEEKDELREEEEEKEEAREEDFQQMFKHHRLLQVSEEMGMYAIFNVPPQLQSSSSLLHLGKMYFCYVRTGMPPHPDPILASDLVIGDDKKRFISIVIFQAIGKTCDTRFFRAKFLHSEHYVVDSPFPNDGFIRGCYVFGGGSTESSKQISV